LSSTREVAVNEEFFYGNFILEFHAVPKNYIKWNTTHQEHREKMNNSTAASEWDVGQVFHQHHRCFCFYSPHGSSSFVFAMKFALDMPCARSIKDRFFAIVFSQA
jgi:hypothetical protein